MYYCFFFCILVQFLFLFFGFISILTSADSLHVQCSLLSRMFWHFDTVYVLNKLLCVLLSNLLCSLSLGQVFYPSFLFVTFTDDISDIGKDEKGLIVLVVFGANHVHVAWWELGRYWLPQRSKEYSWDFSKNGKYQMLLHAGLHHMPCSPHQPENCQQLIATRTLPHLAI